MGDGPVRSSGEGLARWTFPTVRRSLACPATCQRPCSKGWSRLTKSGAARRPGSRFYGERRMRGLAARRRAAPGLHHPWDVVATAPGVTEDSSPALLRPASGSDEPVTGSDPCRVLVTLARRLGPACPWWRGRCSARKGGCAARVDDPAASGGASPGACVSRARQSARAIRHLTLAGLRPRPAEVAEAGAYAGDPTIPFPAQSQRQCRVSATRHRRPSNRPVRHAPSGGFIASLMGLASAR